MSDFEKITWANQENKRREEKLRQMSENARRTAIQKQKDEEKRQLMRNCTKIMYTCSGAFVGAMGCCSGAWFATGNLKMVPAMVIAGLSALVCLTFALIWDKD